MESAVPSGPRKNLIGLSRAELEAELAPLGIERFRQHQLWHWIYHRGAASFAAMSSLSASLRETLAERYVLARPQVARDQQSSDGTRKWLLELADGNLIGVVDHDVGGLKHGIAEEAEGVQVFPLDVFERFLVSRHAFEPAEWRDH